MISAIFMADQYGGVALQGKLPRDFKDRELDRILKLSENQVVVMGKKTWSTLSHLIDLRGRKVYVFTNKKENLPYYAIGVEGDSESVLKEIELKNPEKEIFLLGGPSFVERSQHLLEKIYLTHLGGYHKTDTRVQLRDMLAGMSIAMCESFPDDKSVFIRYESLFRRPPASS